MDFSWAIEGVTEEVPRTTGPECINYMTNRRRWIEAVLFTLLFILVIRWAMRRLDPIVIPSSNELNKPHSAVRLILLISMTFVFGIEMGFKFAGKSVIFVLNPCHIQTVVQIYLLASKPNKITIALFRIQMNNLNGPFLAFLFPEVECRTLPFEQATYWIQHALLYIIPVYIIRTGAYKVEAFNDYNWVTIGVMIMLLYHFVVLNALSIQTGINLNHMLCAAIADPFQGQNYRIAAVIHESILCPILNKMTVLIFRCNNSYNSNNNHNNNSCNNSQLRFTNNSASISGSSSGNQFKNFSHDDITFRQNLTNNLNRTTTTNSNNSSNLINKNNAFITTNLTPYADASTVVVPPTTITRSRSSSSTPTRSILSRRRHQNQRSSSNISNSSGSISGSIGDGSGGAIYNDITLMGTYDDDLYYQQQSQPHHHPQHQLQQQQQQRYDNRQMPLTTADMADAILTRRIKYSNDSAVGPSGILLKSNVDFLQQSVPPPPPPPQHPQELVMPTTKID